MSLSFLLEGQPQFLKNKGFEVHLASSGNCPTELNSISIPFYSIIEINKSTKRLSSHLAINIGIEEERY